jgi:hypothetical protein
VFLRLRFSQSQYHFQIADNDNGARSEGHPLSGVTGTGQRAGTHITTLPQAEHNPTDNSQADQKDDL